MANTKSAAKRARQTIKRSDRNRAVTSNIRTKLKQVRTAVAEGDKESAASRLKSTVSALDRAAKAGRVHRNTANRQKSRLAKAVKTLG